MEIQQTGTPVKQSQKLALVALTCALVALAIGTSIFYTRSTESARATTSSKSQSATTSSSKSSSSSSATKTSTTKTIKIAVTRDGFWFPNRKSDAMDGYGMEYLKAIEKKTGWHFETKVYSLSDAYKALKSGEVDVYGPVSYSKERAEEFLFMDTPSGRTRTTYYTSPDSVLAYRDYKSFNNKRIGVIKGSTSEGVVKKDALINNYSYKPVYFKDNRELVEGILSGKCDIFVAQSMCVSNHENFKIVNELQETNFFFITRNDDLELARELNSAINSIQLANPEFNSTLEERYLATAQNAEPRFTQDEVVFLSHAPVIRIAYVRNLLPFQATATESSNSKSGITGVVGRVLDQISEKTGLKFKGIPYNSIGDAEDAVKAGEANMTASYIPAGETYPTDGKIISTASYLSIPIVSLCQKNHAVSATPTYAVPYSLRWAIPRLRKEQPKSRFYLYPSAKETVKALNDDKVDYVLAGSLMAEQILSNPVNKNLRLGDYTNLVQRLSFGIGESEDENLLRVINATIQSLDANEQNLLLSDPEQNNQSVSVADFMLGNWTYFALGGSLFVLAMVTTLFFVRRRNLKEVEYIAYVDPLTGMPNRTRFVEHITRVLSRNASEYGAVTILDIDNFKSINDMYGMQFGNELIAYFGKRLQEAAPDNAFIAHDVGDTFLIYLDPSDKPYEETMTRIIDAISRISFKHAGTLDFSVSAGMFELNGNVNPNGAINCADIARVNIKEDHSRHVNSFTQEMRTELANQTIMENDLKLAIERDQLELYYQPKIDEKTKTVVGFEALLRWNHPMAGLFGPAAFIPLAERVGLIGAITEWVINENCRNLAYIQQKWHEFQADPNTHIEIAQNGCDYQSAINFSSRDLINPHIISTLTKALETYNIDPCLVEIEITESALLDDPHLSIATLKAIRDLGIAIALDDFGTGYSSLGSLKDLPLTTVKLDRSFIRDIEVDTRGQKVLTSIVEMVNALGYKLVAEGVEQKVQIDFLRSIGCDVMQGFYYAPALPLDKAFDYYVAALQEPVQPGYAPQKAE